MVSKRYRCVRKLKYPSALRNANKARKLNSAKKKTSAENVIPVLDAKKSFETDESPIPEFLEIDTSTMKTESENMVNYADEESSCAASRANMQMVNYANEESSGAASRANMQDQPGPSRSPAPQDFWDGRVSPITDPEDDEAEVMAEPVCGDGEPIMAADPLTTQSSVEGSSKELQSPLQPNYTSTYPLQTLHTQPTTSTTPVIKIEIEDHKEEFLKLQQEVETLKAENQSLIARNHNLAREIFNLKQTSHVLRKDDAIKDTDSIDNDLLSQLAKESHRLSEKISDYADKIQKITSKYEIGENTMDIDQNAHENLDLTNKLRRLIEDNENVIGERDKLKDKVQTLLVDLENLSEENKALKRTVKLQRKRIEMLRIQGVSKTRNLKRLENSCFKLKSMFSKLKMARQNS